MHDREEVHGDYGDHNIGNSQKEIDDCFAAGESVCYSDDGISGEIDVSEHIYEVDRVCVFLLCVGQLMIMDLMIKVRLMLASLKWIFSKRILVRWQNYLRTKRKRATRKVWYKLGERKVLAVGEPKPKKMVLQELRLSMVMVPETQCRQLTIAEVNAVT